MDESHDKSWFKTNVYCKSKALVDYIKVDDINDFPKWGMMYEYCASALHMADNFVVSNVNGQSWVEDVLDINATRPTASSSLLTLTAWRFGCAATRKRNK